MLYWNSISIAPCHLWYIWHTTLLHLSHRFQLKTWVTIGIVWLASQVSEVAPVCSRCVHRSVLTQVTIETLAYILLSSCTKFGVSAGCRVLILVSNSRIVWVIWEISWVEFACKGPTWACTSCCRLHRLVLLKYSHFIGMRIGTSATFASFCSRFCTSWTTWSLLHILLWAAI